MQPTLPQVDPIVSDTTAPINTAEAPAQQALSNLDPVLIPGGFTPENPADPEI